ncbi:L,D-transpeptidase [Aestuariivirga sp.]|jgi:lipoprotein-anchoring transpeptidase ErfK/SrfK|uniref:L,D-transpeptidase n=1 Tax=Aestuariivirga sp. TaxID=2650926 RepID=UPI003783FFBD
MPLTRRHFLGSAAAAAALPLFGEQAFARELAPIFASEAQEVPYRFRRREVDFETAEPVGTIVVDTEKRYLYHVLGQGRAMRYGVGVGDDGKTWAGRAVIRRKTEWPVWRPTPEHIARWPKLEQYRVDGMPGGRDNPMGARALYLYQGKVDTLYRIHGTNKPKGVGRKVTSGCLRMLNVDIVHLYERVEIGTEVLVT